MLRVLPPRAQKLSLLQRVETASTSCNKSRAAKIGVVNEQHLLCILQRKNVSQQGARFCCPYYRTFYLSACLFILVAVWLVVCLALLCFNLVSVQSMIYRPFAYDVKIDQMISLRNYMVSSIIWNKSEFSKGECYMSSLKTPKLKFISKLHKKNHINYFKIKIHMKKFSFKIFETRKQSVLCWD